MLIGIDCNALTLPHRTGVERYVARLLTYMMRLPLATGERVVLYSAAPLSELGALPKGWENRVIPFALPKGWTHLRLSYELYRHPPDVFFSPAHEVPLGVPHKVKVVSTVHDVAFEVVPWVYPSSGARRQRWAIARALKKATKLLAVSETTRNDVMTHHRVAPERIIVTPLGVDRERFAIDNTTRDAVLARHRLTSGSYLFYVGRLEEKKNIVTLLRGFAELKRALGVGHPLQLVLAGNPGFGKERIAQELRHMGSDVRTLGFVPDEDVAALMKGALALCFASHYEGFGLPVLEAFAAGAPVIASAIPAFYEVAGDAALFASPRAPGEWAEAMRRVVLDADLRTSLIAKGTERAEEYTWEKTAARTWEVLRSVA